MAAEQESEESGAETEQVAHYHVAPSPHLSDNSVTTSGMMVDVIIALTPAMLVALYLFHWYAIKQLGLCVLACLAAEAICTQLRGRDQTLADGSAVVTGIILALSLPWSAPWYVAIIGSAVAVIVGKALFGGLGFNLFNPAMVGRAFVMLSFAQQLGAGAYHAETGLQIVTQATPLSLARSGAADSVISLSSLFLGTVNGSLGEVSALALLLGGLYLCVRRSASWEIPAGAGLAVLICAGGGWAAGLTPLTPLHHLCAGALVFGAFFIATDPVSSPLTPRGKFVFGLGFGALVMVLRLFSSYPEGVMFAVLLMNAVVPLINRWAIPSPLGGTLPQQA